MAEDEAVEKKPEEKKVDKPEERRVDDTWIPTTRLGKDVKTGKIKHIDEIMERGTPIKEEQIVDQLLQDIEHDLLLIGQSKGKFGGGKRRAFRQTQKKTAEGNKPKFTTMVVCGNHNGYVGMGIGSAKETIPAREKALRNAKKNMMKIKRGCGSWECGCKSPHSIPFKVRGKCASSVIELIPAPKGVGLCLNDECKKLMNFAGIKDVWSKTYGQTRSRMNLLRACFSALKQLSEIKVSEQYGKAVGIKEGALDE